MELEELLLVSTSGGKVRDEEGLKLAPDGVFMGRWPGTGWVDVSRIRLVIV